MTLCSFGIHNYCTGHEDVPEKVCLFVHTVLHDTMQSVMYRIRYLQILRHLYDCVYVYFTHCVDMFYLLCIPMHLNRTA